MGFSGYGSTVNQGASANMQRAMDTEKGLSPVLGEAGLLGKLEGVVPNPGWKRGRSGGKERSLTVVAEEHNGMILVKEETGRLGIWIFPASDSS